MITPPAPPAKGVASVDGVTITTYEFGDPDARPVLLVHGFASSGLLNWRSSGWVRDLLRADHRIIAIDQRGHGESDKPHSPDAYTIDLLVADVERVLDTFMVDEVDYVGYSLGARVGWRAAVSAPGRIRRLVLGGIPDGDPLTHFQVDQARAFIEDGTPIADRLTANYVMMAGGIQGNDLTALISLVEGMRGGPQPDPGNPPTQPVLFATGSEDPILSASQALAAATPLGSFYEIPDRGHFNAPTARGFRDAALEFLGRA
ncbi:MAG: alpha/beta hydrolase [Homoserinimonas sp.]